MILILAFLFLTRESTLGTLIFGPLFVLELSLLLLNSRVDLRGRWVLLDGLSFFTFCLVFAVLSPPIWAKLFWGFLVLVHVFWGFFVLVHPAGRLLKDGLVEVETDGLLIKRYWQRINLKFSDIANVEHNASSLPRFLRPSGDLELTVLLRLRKARKPGFHLPRFRKIYLNLPPPDVPSFISEVSRRIAAN